MKQRLGRRGLMFVFTLLAGACGSGGGGESCTAGSTQVCDCSGSATGVQSCLPNGTLDVCVCDDLPDAGALPDADQGTDECALGTDNCDANATCTNTTDSFVCACNSGYVGDGVTCAADVDTLVADLSPRVVRFEVAGVGDFMVSKLGRVGIDIGIVEQPVNPNQVLRSPGNITIPNIVMRDIASANVGDIARLQNWSQGAGQSAVLYLVGLNGEALRLEMFEINPVSVDPTVTDNKMAEVVVSVGWFPNLSETVYYTPPTPLSPTPHPGFGIEVEGVLTGGAPFAKVEHPEDGELSLVSWRDTGSSGGALAHWMTRNVQVITGNPANLDRKNMSIFEVNNLGQEVRRVNMYDIWPYRINFFNPTRAYGLTSLVDIFIAHNFALQQ